MGDYDRLKALKEFDDSKGGVKALVDSGLTTIPRFFVHPPENLSDLRSVDANTSIIPTIDLSSLDVVDKMANAAREFGLFQVVNHGIPVDVLDRLIGAIRGFHEQPAEVKAPYYGRKMEGNLEFMSNIDLFQTKAACWRDTLRLKLTPELPELDKIPEICKDEIVEWASEMKRLGDHLTELLCEGLLGAVSGGNLLKCPYRLMVGHYYPYCPEPDQTMGTVSHTDAGLITILLQDHIGGLQVKYADDKWLDVKPVPGALVINLGDMLQMMSNDEYKSVEHRVIAHPFREPRTSIAVFFYVEEDKICGPMPELVSKEKAAIYRQFTAKEVREKLYSHELDGKSLRNYFKLDGKS